MPKKPENKLLYIAVVYRLGEEKIIVGDNLDAIKHDCEDAITEDRFEHYIIATPLKVLKQK